MIISSLSLKNFRCFSSLSLKLNEPFVFLVGMNGIGKTSILESLHYACYLKSFKTHLPKELIQISQAGFSINLEIVGDLKTSDSISIGVLGNKKSVKVNHKPVSSYKDLISMYKVITLTEDDLMLIQGYPNNRRSFIDQLLSLLDFSYITLLRKYKIILNNRNALLNSHKKENKDQYLLWTKQLLDLTLIIQQKRISLLKEIEEHSDILMNNLCQLSSSPLLKPQDNKLIIHYKKSSPYILDTDNLEDFLLSYPQMTNNEYIQKRSLFGAHLDDFDIIFQNKSSRLYSSRGQQKLILFILKLSQLSIINSQQGYTNAIFLVDDFMTDLDEQKIALLLKLIVTHSSQLIITCPNQQSVLKDIILKEYPSCKIISLE